MKQIVVLEQFRSKRHSADNLYFHFTSLSLSYITEAFEVYYTVDKELYLQLNEIRIRGDAEVQAEVYLTSASYNCFVAGTTTEGSSTTMRIKVSSFTTSILLSYLFSRYLILSHVALFCVLMISFRNTFLHCVSYIECHPGEW